MPPFEGYFTRQKWPFYSPMYLAHSSSYQLAKCLALDRLRLSLAWNLTFERTWQRREHLWSTTHWNNLPPPLSCHLPIWMVTSRQQWRIPKIHHSPQPNRQTTIMPVSLMIMAYALRATALLKHSIRAWLRPSYSLGGPPKTAAAAAWRRTNGISTPHILRALPGLLYR